MVNQQSTTSAQAEKFLEDVHSKSLDQLNVSDYKFSGLPKTPENEDKIEEIINKQSSRSLFSKAFLATVAMFTPLSLAGGEHDSAVADSLRGIDRDQSNAVRVYDFTQESWQLIEECLEERRSLNSVPDILQHWNNIDAALHVSDVTAIDSIHDIREEIIRKGGHNSEIPAEVVHSALYTSAKYAESVQDRIDTLEVERAKLQQLISVCDQALEHKSDFAPELIDRLESERSRLQSQLEAKTEEQDAENGLRERIASVVKPYLGKFIVDVQNANRPAERFLVNEAEFNRLKNQYSIVARYDRNNFDQLAAFIMAKAADQETVASAVAELNRHEPGTDRYETALTVLEYLDSGVDVSPEILGRASKFLYAPTATTNANQLLKALGSDLVSVEFGDIANLNAAQQEHVARTIRLLAKHNHPAGLAAASQYFFKRGQQDLASNPTTADFVALEALSTYANSIPQAQSVLHTVIAQHPKFVLENTLMSGSLRQDGSAKWFASKALSEHLNANKRVSQQVVRQLLRGNFMMRAQDGQQIRISLEGSHRETARRTGLQVILASPVCSDYKDVFHEILDNDFSSEHEQAIALQGLARAGDIESKQLMLQIGADSNLSESIRSIALECALKLDIESEVDSELLATVQEQYPFSVLELANLTTLEQKDSLENFGATSVFKAAIENRVSTWLERQSAARAMADANAQVSDSEIQRMLHSTMRREFGAGISFSDELSQEQVEQFNEMLDYLKDCKSPHKAVDMDLALPMIQQMSRAGFKAAQEVFVDMARFPEHYASDPDRQGSFASMYNASDTAMLKGIVIQSLGGVVNLDNSEDPALEILLTVARRDSSRQYRADAQIGLEQLAERFKNELDSANPDQAGDLLSVRESIASKVLEILHYHAAGHSEHTQRRLANISDQFSWAKLVDKFGGAALMLDQAASLMEQDPNNMEGNGADTARFQRPELARAVVHAMISNGKTAEDLKEMGLGDEQLARFTALFEFIEQEQYWLAKLRDREYTGEGQEFALVDVGYVKPNPLTPEMNRKVVYPKLLSPGELYISSDYHPTAVAATYFAKNPDAKIRTYSATSPMPFEEFRPEHTRDAFIRSLEDIAELQIAGEADVDVINYSLGFMNAALHNPEIKDQLLDLIRAHMEVLSKMGVTHSTAAANSYADPVDSARYGAFGEVNSIGVAIKLDGTPVKQPGVFIAGAQDAYAGAAQAEFQSVLESLRADHGLNIIAFDGVHVLLPWYEDGKWVLVPVNGTSFGSPNQAAMLSWADEAAEKAGVKISHEEMQELFAASTMDIKDRDDSEGGKYFHVPTFLTKLNELLGEKANN